MQFARTISYLSSDYELNISRILMEKLHNLQEMQNNNNSSKVAIDSIKMELEALESLYDNYNNGMNYFRRAQGGRNGLREVHDKT
jgi:colicin import membrane protein